MKNITRTCAYLAVALPAGVLLFGFILFLLPMSIEAGETTSRLGGGNSLLRATTGISHTSNASNLFDRLGFASTNGGRPEETPPSQSQSNSGGDTSTDQQNGQNGQNGASAGGGTGDGGDDNNGGATAGNGGDGGDGGGASNGGLVRAGGVVSNATALNMINVNIIRISTR